MQPSFHKSIFLTRVGQWFFLSSVLGLSLGFWLSEKRVFSVPSDLDLWRYRAKWVCWDLQIRMIVNLCQRQNQQPHECHWSLALWDPSLLSWIQIPHWPKTHHWSRQGRPSARSCRSAVENSMPQKNKYLKLYITYDSIHKSILKSYLYKYKLTLSLSQGTKDHLTRRGSQVIL